MRALAGACALLAVAVVTSIPAGAAPAVPPLAPQALPVEQVHGYHRSCRLGRAGWHYHARGARIACAPRPAGNYWIWRFGDGRWGWWNRHERRWHDRDSPRRR